MHFPPQIYAVSAMFGLIVDYPGDESQENMLIFQFPHHVGTAAKDDLLTQLRSLISNAKSISDKVSIHPHYFELSLYKQIVVSMMLISTTYRRALCNAICL